MKNILHPYWAGGIGHKRSDPAMRESENGMHLTIRHKTENRSAVLKIFFAAGLGVVLVGVISLVLWNYYRSQAELKAASIETFKSGLDRRASALGYYFMKRKAELAGLAGNKSVANYFVNKDLGMSLAYGLRASLIQMNAALIELLGKNSIADRAVYLRLAIIEKNGEILADTDEDASTLPLPHSVENTARRPTDGVRIHVLEIENRNALCMEAAVYHKKAYEGTLFALLNLDVLSDDLLSKTSGTQIESYMLTYEKLGKCAPLRKTIHTALDDWITSIQCQSGEIVRASPKPSEGLPEELMVIHVPVGETPLFLTAAISPSILFGSTAPVEIIGLLAVLVLVLSATVIMLFWAGHRNIVLDTLVAEEEKYRYLIENAQDIIYSTDARGNFTYLNPVSEKITGYPTGELIGQNYLKLASPTVRDGIQAFYENQYAQRAITTYHEIPIMTKSGETRWLGQNVQMEFSDGKAIGYRAVARDITELKRTRDLLQQAHDKLEERVRQRTQALRASNDKLAAEIGKKEKAKIALHSQLVFLQKLIDTIPNPIYYKNNKGVYLGCNLAFEQQLGLSRRHIIGKSADELARKEPVVIYKETRDERSPSNADNFEARLRHPDGRIQNVIVNRATFIDSRQQPAGHVCVIMDITERKRLESRLLQAQKLQSIGALAAGISHEINTPIQFIGDNTRFLSGGFGDLIDMTRRMEDLAGNLPSDAAHSKFIQHINELKEELDFDYLTEEIPLAIEQTLEGVAHVAKIVGSMKEFSHPGTENKIETDINRAIENTIIVARNEWKYSAEIVTDFSADLPMVFCFAAEFNQVILNLIVNAVHAIADALGENGEEKGKITIRTRQIGDWVEIRVSDTGAGIPEAIRDRIFDPFFTTKMVGRGTGQGLAVSRSVIVEKHGGQLAFETSVGEGTTFIVRLPISHPDETAREEVAS